MLFLHAETPSLSSNTTSSGTTSKWAKTDSTPESQILERLTKASVPNSTPLTKKWLSVSTPWSGKICSCKSLKNIRKNSLFRSPNNWTSKPNWVTKTPFFWKTTEPVGLLDKRFFINWTLMPDPLPKTLTGDCCKTGRPVPNLAEEEPKPVNCILS